MINPYLHYSNEFYILTNKLGCHYNWNIILEKFKKEYCSIFRMQLSCLDWKFRNMNEYLSICQVPQVSDISAVSLTVKRYVWWFYLTTFVDNHVSKVLTLKYPWLYSLDFWVTFNHLDLLTEKSLLDSRFEVENNQLFLNYVKQNYTTFLS